MTVKRLEGGQPVNMSSHDKLRVAFNAVGIVFIAAGETSSEGGEGVRLTPKPE